MNSMPFRNGKVNAAYIAAALDKPRQSGNGWSCCCPAHKDSNPSLSVSDTDDGKILVHCHAGCSQEEVIDALKELGLWSSIDQPDISYNYLSADGSVLYQVVRGKNKKFLHRRPDGNGGWIWKNAMTGIEKVPYRLPELIETVKKGGTVFIAEGEKDVDNLASAGLTATTNSGGAGKWNDKLSEYLDGAKEVIILPDNDKVGEEHAQAVAQSLRKQAIPLKIVRLPLLPDKGDVSDWLENGGSKRQLLELCVKAAFYAASQNGQTNEAGKQESTGNPQPQAKNSITPIGAAELMKTIYPKPYWAIEGLLPAGLTIFAAPPKTGKSWLALKMALSISTGGKVLGVFKANRGKVLYLALEDGHRRLQDRLNKLAEIGGIIFSNDLIISTTINRADEGGLQHLEQKLDEYKDCRTVIIDTEARFKPAPTKNMHSYDSDTRAYAPLQQLAIKRQIALILITHLRKQKGSDDPYEQIMGSVAVTGTADAIWLLKRRRAESQGTLSITGRDLEEQDLAIRFDKNTCEWTVLGDATRLQLGQERLDVLEYLEQSTESVGPKEVAEALGKKTDNIKALMWQMFKDGQINKSGRGKYSAIDIKEVFKEF